MYIVELLKTDTSGEWQSVRAIEVPIVKGYIRLYFEENHFHHNNTTNLVYKHK